MNLLRVPQNRMFSQLKSLSMFLAMGLLVSGVVTWSGCVRTVDEVSEKPFTQPVIDKRLSLDDFAFPSAPPSLAQGQKVFSQNCAACHAPAYWQQHKVQTDLAYSTPIDFYLMLTTGEAPPVTHPSDERRDVLPKAHADAKGDKMTFRKLSRDDRWAAIFYARHLAGFDDIAFNNDQGKKMSMSADVFGGNCAVCHGTRGFADGFLATGRPSKHGVEGGKVHIGLFEPPPANFHDYRRMYNRTDAQLHKYISQGIYPSAMPRWYGRMDKGKHYTFNDDLIWKMARYVRQFSYNAADLPADAPIPPGYIPTSDTNKNYVPQTSMDMPKNGAPAPEATSQQDQQAGESHS